MLINKEYLSGLKELKNKYSEKSKEATTKIKKLDVTIEFLQHKKNLMARNMMTAKKAFSRNIYKTSKKISKRSEAILIEKSETKELDDFEKKFLTNQKLMRKKMILNYTYKSILYTILIAYLFITLYPFLWSIFSSFKSDSEISSGSFNPFPKQWTTKNYDDLFHMGGGLINSWIMNSFLVSFFGTLGNLVLNTFAGYALARIAMPGRNKIMWVLLALMMVPGQVGLIPNYILLKQMHMVNNISALIIPALVSISFIFMSRQFFLTFPRDVEEASKMDGQTRFGFIFKSVMPLMKPILMTQAVFSFMGFWNNFMIAKMYIDVEKNYTLTVGIQSLLERDAHSVSYGQILAGSSISLFPVLLLYTILNSAFMSSNRTDGDK